MMLLKTMETIKETKKHWMKIKKRTFLIFFLCLQLTESTVLFYVLFKVGKLWANWNRVEGCKYWSIPTEEFYPSRKVHTEVWNAINNCKTQYKNVKYNENCETQYKSEKTAMKNWETQYKTSKYNTNLQNTIPLRVFHDQWITT